jgi:serine O-acetyltransferase
MPGKTSLLRRIWGDFNLKFDYDRYFSRRETYQTTKNPLVRAWCFHYCTKINNRFCAFIPLTLDLPRSVVFPHGISGVYISVGSKVGENCTIFHQVTIGSNTLEGSDRRGAPSIGDNVFIGAGAKLIGGINVGSNVRIGAGCSVGLDIPENATAVAAAPRIILGHMDRENVFLPPSVLEK